MARNFNGSTSLVTATSSWGSSESAATISMWIYPRGLSAAYAGLFRTTNAAQMYIRSNGNIAIYGFYVAADPVTADVLVINKWYHILVTGDGTSGTYYLNGVSKTTSAGATALNLSGTIHIGNDPPNTPRFYQGGIADVAIWRGKLTSAEASALASGMRAKYIRRGNLVGYWPMNGLSPYEPDATAYAKNGSVTGPSLFIPDPPFIPDINTFGIQPEASPIYSPEPSFISGWSRQSNLPVIGGGTF